MAEELVRIFTRLSLGISILLCACTTIVIEGAEEVNTTRHFGFAIVSPVANDKPMLVDAKGYGISVKQSGVTVGVSSERTLLVPDPERCSAIFVLESGLDLAWVRNELAFILRGTPNLCYVVQRE